MKHTKKLLSILLALAMVVALSVSAMAATITVKDEGGISSYEAYRLLNATNAVDDEGNATDLYAYTLNNKYEAVLKDISGKTTEADVVAYIGGLDAAGTRTFADDVYGKVKDGGLAPDATATSGKFEDVPQGYYLIVETDVTKNEDGTSKDTISLVMLDTAGQEAIEVETKEDAPTVEKKVKDTNDTKGEITEWQDSADYDIGDKIPYQVTGGVSSKIANYKEYYYKFTDTMTHLTYDADSAKIMVGEKDITDSFIIGWDESTKTLTATCNDLKAIEGLNLTADSKVVLTYTATLDEGANIGATGNPNTVYLTYSNNPYYESDGENDNPPPPPTNDTPKDTNIVFTYKVVVNKVDKEGNALNGAGFTLFKKDADGNYNPVCEEIKDVTTFEFKGLDDGEYKLVETTVPDGYNKAADIEFEVYAEHEEEADSPKLIKLNGVEVTGTITIGEDEKATVVTQEGSITTNVVNNSGTELPSTGGVGTTLFYVVGGILVVAASVVLVTKRRMKSE